MNGPHFMMHDVKGQRVKERERERASATLWHALSWLQTSCKSTFGCYCSSSNMAPVEYSTCSHLKRMNANVVLLPVKRDHEGEIL